MLSRLLGFGLLAGTLLLATGKEVVLVNEIARIAANQSKRYVFALSQPNATLHLHFSAKHAAEGVRVVVSQKATGHIFADTGYQETFTQAITLSTVDDYFVEIQNQRQTLGEAQVTIRLELVMEVPKAKPVAPQPRFLSATRQYFTVAASIAIFLMGVAFSAVKLGPALRQRMRG